MKVIVKTCKRRTQAPAEPSTQSNFSSINEEVVGFEEDDQSIMQKLTGGRKELDVISIFGMAGIGKTTLARKAYNNPSIVNWFDVKAWCTISQTYNVKTLLVEIFKQATRDRSEIKDDVDIADVLRKSLIRRRYLIVLDDIWKVEAWEDLRLCFPNNENGSRVMVTTRIEEVAKHLQHRSDPYSLRFLTTEESWELLQRKVFQGESCPPDLQYAGLQVARHCKGLPLAIVMVAGIIKEKERQASLWLEVANDLSSQVLGEQGMKVIQTSYDHLEDHLKHCLLYMALFPEDYEIPVTNLLKLWMAEEFVLNVEKENMEEASSICLNDLLNKSLVMVSRRRINGDVECCTLHDVVREFCLTKLREEEYMQLTVPYNPYQHLYSKESRLCVYIHDDLVEQLDHSEYRPDKIKMLDSKETTPLEFIAHPEVNAWKQTNPLPLLVKLRFVRVLHLMDVKLSSSRAEAVQSLTLLRYLAVRVEDEFEFSWVSQLHDLQTIQVISSVSCLNPRAAYLWEMKKLRHVNINNFSLEWKYNDRAIIQNCSTTMLENLKSFRRCLVRVDDMNPRYWWRFPNLEELSLKIEEVPSYPLFPVPDVHTRLLSLHLAFNHRGFRDLVGWESYFVFPSNIRDLHLSGNFLTDEMVSNIARLRKLESLTLERGFHLGASGYCWDVRKVEFPALKYLTLVALMMDEWNASEESFPMLDHLVLRTCYYFKEIPSCFVDIPTFRLIELFDCPHAIVDSAMNIKREIEENTGFDSLQVLISKR